MKDWKDYVKQYGVWAFVGFMVLLALFVLLSG